MNQQTELQIFPKKKELTDHDQRMVEKGYRYRLRPMFEIWEPLYAKTIQDVSRLQRDYSTTKFSIERLVD